MKIKFLLFLILLPLIIHSQNGVIRGSVFDKSNGETLPGVTIYVENTTFGAISDFDGKFNINIPPGKYNLRVSFISYETIYIKELLVIKSKTTLIDNIKMIEANVELDGVVINAKAIKNTETSILTLKRKSSNLIDGISASKIKKIGDSNVSESIKRISGISTQNGKYVYIRGLGDRYSKTLLNGMDIPSLDPNRNSLQIDIFPTNIVDNIIVLKSFTPELPADFTGGVINIETKELPEEKNTNISISLGYNPYMHFNKNYLTYKGGKYDWLGFDDGTRRIPATSNIPFFSTIISNPDGEDAQRYQDILNSFNPNLSAMRKNSFMDFGFGVSLGNQFNKKKVTWGYNVSFSYKNETEYYENVEFGKYGLSSNPNIYKMEQREIQKGDYGINNVLISGMFGVSLKTNKSKYKLNILHLQNGISKAGIFDYNKNNQGTEFSGFQHNLEYTQRKITNILLNGKHFLNNNWNIEWKFSPTLSSIYDPDIRFTRYLVNDEGDYIIGTESGFPQRIWREMDEINYSGVIDIDKKYEFLGNGAIFKFGTSYTYKLRDYNIKSFSLNIRNIPLTGNPDELFWEENLWPYNSNIGSGTTYEANFIPNNPNKYSSNINVKSGYLLNELFISYRLKMILGVRIENFTQRYTGSDQLGNNILDNEKVIDDVDFFPSINFIYELNEKQNLRLSYSKTIARPSFKELSYSEIYDPISGWTFIGGFFRDADDVSGVEYWDGNLISTDIHNFDLRWELFKERNQMLSIGGFYKYFINPIEYVQYFTLTGAYQPRNVGDGELLGAEIEFRKNLDFIGLNNFSLNANFTYTKSKVKLSKTELESRINNARTGEEIPEYRDMAGQSPYLINVGIFYNGGERGITKGLNAGLYYNVQGETLYIVGIVDRPDIYISPFNSLNFNLNKNIDKNNKIRIGFKIDNLLFSKKEIIYKSYMAEDEYFSQFNPGVKFSVNFSYKL